MSVIAITLYSRPGCHLCDEMKTLVELLNKVRAPHEPDGSTWR